MIWCIFICLGGNILGNLIIAPILNIHKFINYNSELIFLPSIVHFLLPYLFYIDSFLIIIFVTFSISNIYYYTIHLTMQYLILNNYIQNLTTDFGNLNDALKLHSKVYQDIVYERLCFCVKYHVLLLK